MILKINPNLFTSKDRNVLSKISQILLEILDDKFIWDGENFDELFLSDDENNFFKSPFSEDWLSKGHKELLLEKIETIFAMNAYVTDVHKKYLTTISIGTEDDELHPQLAYDVLTKPSKIITENATNDWKLIKFICEKYTKSNSRKEIYKLVKKSIENKSLLPDNAGGTGQIRNRIKDLSNNEYKNISKYKIAVLFDSDRENSNSIKNEQKKIIEFLKGKQVLNHDISYEDTDIIVWHMLYKRELENYLPKNVILEYHEISEAEKIKIGSLSESDYDFVDFESILKNIDVKSIFPELFLTQCTKDKLEERCLHHKVYIELPNGTLEQVSEMEQILLKIAKII